MDDPLVADTGAGTPPIVDMGAYEFFQPVVILLDWKSVGVHGPVGEVGLVIPTSPAFSEPRLTGINKIVVTFAGEIDVSGASATVEGCDIDSEEIDLSYITVVTTAGTGSTVEITFEDAGTPVKLPGSELTAHDPARYEIVLDGVTNRCGLAVAADARFVTAVLGDAYGDNAPTGDLVVDADDSELVRSLAAQNVDPIDPATVAHVRSDVWTDGKINAADNGLVRSLATQGLDGTGITCP